MQRIPQVVLMAAALALALAQMSCIKCECTCVSSVAAGGVTSVFINKDCKIESAQAAEVVSLDVDQGDVIVWTNLKTTEVKIFFDTPGGTAWVLPGDLVIKPLSTAVSTVKTGVAEGEYGWRIVCDGAESSGTVHLPPPQPGSGTGDG